MLSLVKIVQYRWFVLLTVHWNNHLVVAIAGSSKSFGTEGSFDTDGTFDTDGAFNADGGFDTNGTFDKDGTLDTDGQSESSSIMVTPRGPRMACFWGESAEITSDAAAPEKW